MSEFKPDFHGAQRDGGTEQFVQASGIQVCVTGETDGPKQLSLFVEVPGLPARITYDITKKATAKLVIEQLMAAYKTIWPDN